MYSQETINRTIGILQERISFYNLMNPDDIKMCISTGNDKIGKTLNVSLAPIITCKNCKECQKYCYDVKAVLAYPSCMDARARNTALFMKDRNAFFARLHKRMKNRRARKALRFHVSGEIVDINHLERIIETAKMFPDWTIWTYTKVYWIVNKYVREHGNSRKVAIPANLHIMFSEWDGLKMNNPYGFPTFRCILKDKPQKLRKGEMVCPGNCDYCLKHKVGCVAGKSVATVEH